MFSRHLDYLEKENGKLREQLQDMTNKYHELVMQKLKPEEKSSISPSIPVDQKKKIIHTMDIQGDDRTKCSCGWICIESDPAEMQNKIQAHYRSNVVDIHKKSWPQKRAEVEARALAEAMTEAAKKKILAS